MAPFPPVTGPVTVGSAAEGRGRWASPACAGAAAPPSRDVMVIATATRVSQRGVLVMRLRVALMAGTFHRDAEDISCADCQRKVTPLPTRVKYHFRKPHTRFSLTVSIARRNWAIAGSVSRRRPAASGQTRRSTVTPERA